MIVMKFGGTSVESAAAIERVAGIVKAREERRPVVVVSAMGKTTNKLLAMARQKGDSLRAVAERVATERFERIRSSGGNRSKLFLHFLDYYRRGLIPGWPIGMISPVYFNRITQLGFH